jgi:hypothetical protein
MAFIPAAAEGYQAVDKGLRLAYWSSIIAILICLILIIISFVKFKNKNTKTGWTLLIIGGLGLGLSSFAFHKSNLSTSSYLYQQGRRTLGMGEDEEPEFDGDTVVDKDCTLCDESKLRLDEELRRENERASRHYRKKK